jgi:hypothetical protein
MNQEKCSPKNYRGTDYKVRHLRHFDGDVDFLVGKSIKFPVEEKKTSNYYT